MLRKSHAVEQRVLDLLVRERSGEASDDEVVERVDLEEILVQISHGHPRTRRVAERKLQIWKTSPLGRLAVLKRDREKWDQSLAQRGK